MSRKQSEPEGGEHAGREQAAARGGVGAGAGWGEKGGVSPRASPREPVLAKLLELFSHSGIHFGVGDLRGKYRLCTL